MSFTKLIYDKDNKLDRLELWGSSTKHPDCVFFYSDFNKSPYITEEAEHWNIFQFMVECAAKLSLPFGTINVLNFAHNYIIDKIMELDNCSREQAEETYNILAL